MAGDKKEKGKLVENATKAGKTAISPSDVGDLSFNLNYAMHFQGFFELFRIPEADAYMASLDDDRHQVDGATGGQVIARLLQDAHIESWKKSYDLSDSGICVCDGYEWSLSLEDVSGKNLFYSSGDNEIPPDEMFSAALAAVRSLYPGFGKQIEELEEL